MTMNQLQENKNGCLEQKENEDEGISSILEELETYICDEICLRDTKLTQEKQEQYCAGCKLESYIDRIGQEYDKINTFGKTAAHQLMKKYRNIVFCEECEHRWHSKSEDTNYCCCIDGICRILKPGDGCSCGKRKE